MRGGCRAGRPGRMPQTSTCSAGHQAKGASLEEAEWAPWGLQLIGDWSEARALADYRKLQLRFPQVLGERKALVLRGRMAGRGSATWYRVRVAESTRARAQELCGRLERAGGKCLVLHN